MKSSNLAQRLEEFEADIASLRLTGQPETQVIMTRDGDRQPQPAVRRAPRAPRIVIRDDGLRPFRVR
jgi:hypothetical protein